jgi:hypothetical protein
VNSVLTPNLRDYEIEHALGVRNYGTLYTGHFKSSGHGVMLLKLSDVLATDQTYVNELAAAGQQATHLRSDAALAVYDLVNESGDVWLITERPTGPCLANLFEQFQRLPPQEAFAVVDDVLRAVIAAHELGIVHGNICPELVWLRDDGSAQLGGFALGSTLEAFYEDPATEAPASMHDLYQCASLLHHLIAGYPPKAGVVDDPHIKPVVAAVLQSALAKTSMNRFSTAQALRQAVRSAAKNSVGPNWQEHADLAGLARGELDVVEVPVILPKAAVEELPTPESLIKTATKAPRRRHWPARMGFLIAIALAGVALAFSTGKITLYAPAYAGPLQVGQPKITVAQSGTGCDLTYTAVATGTVRGQGNLVYRFERSDGTIDPTSTVGVTADEATFTLSTVFRISGSTQADGIVTFHLLQPSDNSVQTRFSHHC